MNITLVCMAPSGETFVTRDERGLMWLHQPVGAGGAGPVDEATATFAVAQHGFDRIERTFDDWPALDDYRLERAALVTPAVVVDREAFDVHDVRRLLAVAQEWAAKGDALGASSLVLELLKVPAVRDDPETYAALVEFLEGPGRPRPLLGPPPASPLKAKARQVWKQLHDIAA